MASCIMAIRIKIGVSVHLILQELIPFPEPPILHLKRVVCRLNQKTKDLFLKDLFFLLPFSFFQLKNLSTKNSLVYLLSMYLRLIHIL